METGKTDFARNLALWVIVALLLVALFNLFQPLPGERRPGDLHWVAYSDFLNDVNANRFREALFRGHWVTGFPSHGGRNIHARIPEAPELVADLARRMVERGVRVSAWSKDMYADPPRRLFADYLLPWSVTLLAMGVWAYYNRTIWLASKRFVQEAERLRDELDQRLRRLEGQATSDGPPRPPAGSGG